MPAVGHFKAQAFSIETAIAQRPFAYAILPITKLPGCITMLKWNNIKKILLLAGIIVLVLLVAPNLDILHPDNILRLAELPSIFTALGFILLYAAKGIILIIPSGPLYVGAGMAFPTWLGVLVTYVGLAVALAVGYFIGQWMGEERVTKMLAKNKKVYSFLCQSKENLLFLSFISRVLPTPFGLVSLFFGAMNVPFYKYMFVSLLGLTPFMIPIVFAGAAITNPLSAEFLVPFGISLGITLMIFVAYRTKFVTRLMQS